MNAYPNLWQVLLKKSVAYKDKGIVYYGNDSLSYSRLMGEVRNFSNFLENETSQNVVGINVSDPINGIIVMISALVAGKAFWFTNNELLNTLDAEVFDSVFHVNDKIYNEGIAKGIKKNVRTRLSKVFSNHHPFCWTTSSGSMSVPKITEHSYQSIIEDTYRQIRSHSITEDDRIDLLSTTSFSASLASIFPVIFSGASLHIKPVNSNVPDIYDFWLKEKITMTTLVPTVFRSICSLSKDFKKLSLRFVCLGGERVVKSDLILAQDNFNPNVKFQVALASSECRSIADFIYYPTQPLPESDSIPYSIIEDKHVYIVDDNNKRVAPNNEGKLIVESKIIGTKYINTSGSFELLDDGNYRFVSDDSGKIDQDGFLYVSSKYQRKIKIKGQYVDLDFVENQVSRLNGIDDCFATKYDEFEDVFLFVVSKFNKEKIQKLIADNLGFKGLHIDILRNELPKTSSGKLHAELLKKRIITDKRLTDNDNYYSTWKQIFPSENNFENKHFFDDLGGDSIQALMLINELSLLYKTEIQPNLIYRFPVYNDLSKNLLTTRPLDLLKLNSCPKPLGNILIFSWVNGRNIFGPLIESWKDKYCFYVIIYPIKQNSNYLTSKEIGQNCAAFLQNHNAEFCCFIGHSYAGLLTYYTAFYLDYKFGVALFDTPTYQKRKLLVGPQSRLFGKLKRSVKVLVSPTRIKLFLLKVLKNATLKPNETDIKTKTKESLTFDPYSDFFNNVTSKSQVIPNTKFPMGLFVAQVQSSFGIKIAPDFKWNKYNTNVIFKKKLPGNHMSILDERNIKVICTKLNDLMRSTLNS